MKPDFDNTEQAFAHLSNRELRNALVLFQTVGSPFWVRMGKVLMNAALRLGIPVGWAIRPTVYAHFCGGESIEKCENTVAKLADSGVRTILDYSAEGKDNEMELDQSCEEILRTVEAAGGDDRMAFNVFKVSGVAANHLLEQVSAGQPHDVGAWAKVEARVARICKAVADSNGRVFIDAEESWLQPAIDQLAESEMRRHNGKRAIVFNTIQLYRHDRLAYLERLTAEAREGGWQLGVKLVRGAYMEKERIRAAERALPSPIQQDKAASDRDFNAALKWCIQNLDVLAVCNGSHNAESNGLLCQMMMDHGLSSNDNRVWFAQLLGMSDPISFNLAACGYNVAKYVPYGPIREAVPYLIRRAEENTSVAGQTSRELELLRKERARRKREKVKISADASARG